jgi:hypothetical protein
VSTTCPGRHGERPAQRARQDLPPRHLRRREDLGSPAEHASREPAVPSRRRDGLRDRAAHGVLLEPAGAGVVGGKLPRPSLAVHARAARRPARLRPNELPRRRVVLLPRQARTHVERLRSVHGVRPVRAGRAALHVAVHLRVERSRQRSAPLRRDSGGLRALRMITQTVPRLVDEHGRHLRQGELRRRLRVDVEPPIDIDADCTAGQRVHVRYGYRPAQRPDRVGELRPAHRRA